MISFEKSWALKNAYRLWVGKSVAATAYLDLSVDRKHARIPSRKYQRDSKGMRAAREIIQLKFSLFCRCKLLANCRWAHGGSLLLLGQGRPTNELFERISPMPANFVLAAASSDETILLAGLAAPRSKKDISIYTSWPK